MIFLLSKVLKPLLIVGAIALIGFGIYWYFSQERKRELNPVMEELAIRTSRELAHKLPRLQNIEELLVIPVIGGRHEDEHLSNIVIDAISRKRKYTVWTWNDLQEKMENGTLWQKFIDNIGLMPGQPPKTVEKAKVAISALNKANIQIDGVLFIKCLFDQGPRDDNLGSKIELDGKIYHAGKSSVVKGYDLHSENGISSRWDRLYLTHKIQGINYFVRLILWALVAFGIPWVMMGPTRWVLKKRDNGLIAAYLVCLVIIGIFTGWFLLTAVGPILDVGTIFFMLLLGGAVLWVNHDALDYIQRRLL